MFVDTGISTPNHVTHDTHVEVGDDGLKIDNIPPSWVALFKEAGASDKDLKNSKLVFELMVIVAETLSARADRQSSPNSPQISFDESPSNSTEHISTSKPETSVPVATNKNDAPAPPPLAPPPPPQVSPSSTGNSSVDLMSGIQGIKLEHREPVKKVSRDNLLSEIRQKPSLRHVDEDELDKLSKVERNDLTAVLSKALDKFHVQMNPDENDDAGYWSD